LINPEKTIVRAEVPPTESSLPEDLHPVLRRVYAIRNQTDAASLERGLAAMLSVSLLDGVEHASALLHEVMVLGERILILADFDADGATSCALAMRGLRAMGAGNLAYLVPNRFQYGYGLTPEIVAVAREHSPALIVTVDNGISSIQGVRAAKEAGIKVLVTDHHLPGAELPDADAIVNPNIPGNRFPSKHLAGVGVIFYLLAALRQRLDDLGWFAELGMDPPNLAELLDLVALGTVADVVPLDHNNRILVHQGLQRMRAGCCCAGISALADIAERALPRLVAADLGFAIGPRLNAAGRIEDMSIGIECLLTDDPQRAKELAGRLDSLNRTRRSIEQEMKRQAVDYLQALPADDVLPTGLCIYRDDWHQGVIGILAARIREQCNRPVIAFAPAEEEQMIKGSARSISGLHIRDVLDAVAAANPGLLSKFGGHAMAAGLSLRLIDFERFSREFDREVRCRVDEDSLRGVVRSDGELGLEDLRLELAELLRAAGPWGQGFPEPLFDGYFVVVQKRVVAERHLKLLLRPLAGEGLVDAIAFNQAERDADVETIHAAFRLDVNEFRGRRSLQLLIEYFQPYQNGNYLGKRFPSSR